MSGKVAKRIPDTITDKILAAQHVLLVTHVFPDGDAFGSIFGLAKILEEAGKKVLCYFDEPVSYLYDFLPGSDRAVHSFDQVRAFRQDNSGVLILALDAGDSSRLGKFEKELLDGDETLVVDHHRSHKNYGDDRWVVTSMSSTGEMVYELARELGYTISYEAAVNLWVAICTDTGSFRYESTSPRTLRIAADLVERGVRPDVMASCLFDNLTISRLSLMKKVLATLEMYGCGRLAVMHVTGAMIEEAGASADDVEGFVDYPRSIKSVQVAVFIKSIRQGTISVSLRAKGECDVAVVAEKFGGGGHRNAAGFRFKDLSLAEVKTLVIDELFFRLGINGVGKGR